MTNPAAVTEPLVVPPAAFTSREREQARRLQLVMVIMAVFFVAEMAGAIWADSDVLRVEAVHVLTDVAALGLAALAIRIAARRPTARFTFGLRRVEPVAAIFNALLLLLAMGFLVVEAIENLSRSTGPQADRMLLVAVLGLVVNGVAAWLIHGAIGAHPAHHRADEHVGAHAEHTAGEAACQDYDHRHIVHHAHRGHGHVLNLRGAWLHLFGDALGSLAAIVAALAIRVGFTPKADPIASIVVAGILVYGGVRLLRDAILILLEASPPHLPVDEVRSAILAASGVMELHDLHVWTLGSGHDAITAHVAAKAPDPSLASRVEADLRRRFHVEYVTIQVEVGGVTCQAESDDA